MFNGSILLIALKVIAYEYLIHIIEETAEREALITKAQVDGLTKLYNASTVKEYIIERINNKESHIVDAFILIDFDDFKYINDRYAHLVGDKILEYLGEALKNFRSADIIGRIGGDESCIYLKIGRWYSVRN